jgi:hypothetical protein
MKQEVIMNLSRLCPAPGFCHSWSFTGNQPKINYNRYFKHGTQKIFLATEDTENTEVKKLFLSILQSSIFLFLLQEIIPMPLNKFPCPYRVRSPTASVAKKYSHEINNSKGFYHLKEGPCSRS